MLDIKVKIIDFDNYNKDFVYFEGYYKNLRMERMMIGDQNITNYDLALAFLQQINSSVLPSETLKNSSSITNFIKEGNTLEFVPYNNNIVLRFPLIDNKIISTTVATPDFESSVNVGFEELGKKVDAYKSHNSDYTKTK